MVDQVGHEVSGVSETTMVSLHIELQRCAPALDMFLSWCISFYVSSPPPKSALFTALGKSSPVCALPPQLDSLEELYQKLFNNEPVQQFSHDMLLLQQSSPLLFDIISIIEGDQMPDVLCTLISDLLHKTKTPLGVNSLADCGSPNTSQAHDLKYFPALRIVRSRGDYSFYAIYPDICTKRSSRHPSLLPGIFLLHCQHGNITYGFNVMLCSESPNVPFTVFRTRFSKAPRLIVYDNACNLHSYFLNRDPVFFKNTQFLVDRLHWRDHTGCSEAYNLSRFPQWHNLDSLQAAEHANSCLQYIKEALSHMNQ